MGGGGGGGSGGKWHMPQQTLEYVRKPGFCRAVQHLFLDAIEGDGSAQLSADMLYPVRLLPAAAACCCCPKKEDCNNTAVFLLGHICFKTNTRPFANSGSGHNQTQQKLTKLTFCSCLPQDQSMRFTSLCRQVPTMSRADAEQQYRFPWKMPFAIYEPVTGKRGDRRNERNTRRLFCCTFTNAQNHNPLSAL
jgi:hypothetical protein